MGISQRNGIAAGLAFISGLIFLFSGTTSYGIWKKTEELVLSTIHISLLKIIFSVTLVLAFFGCLLFFIAAWLFLRNYIHWGRIFIAIGVGSGIISLAFHIYLTLSSSNSDFTWLFTTSTLAILLSIAARTLAKKQRR